MQNQKVFFGGMILVMILLAACSTQTPTQEPTPTMQPSPTTASAPLQPTAEATAPVVADTAAYPAPVVQYVPLDPYPSPIEGEQIEWSEVEALLNSGQVAEVFQRYSLPVVITLKDGRIILVVSPAKDDIFMLLDKCGEKCNGIRRLSNY